MLKVHHPSRASLTPPDKGAKENTCSAPAPTARRSWEVLVVFAVAVCLYAPSLGYDLVWDDGVLVGYVKDRLLAGGLPTLLSSEFRLENAVGYYRPVVLLSMWLDSLLGGGAAWAYHGSNILLHGMVSVLVFLFVAALVPSRGGAFLGALVFAVHPAHVESVAFVSGRTDLWAALFTLSAAVLWARWRGRGGRKESWAAAGSGVALLLACFSKEVAFLLPVALVALGVLVERPGLSSGIHTSWARWGTGWCAALAFALGMRHSVGVGLGPGWEALAESHIAPVAQNLWLLPSLWMTYLRLLILPWPLQAIYTPSDIASWVHLPAAVAMIALCGLTCSRTVNRAGCLALLWIVVFLLPVSGVVPLRGALVAERFLYLPSVGISLAVAAAFGRWATGKRRTPLLVAAAVTLVGTLAVGTVVYARTWSNGMSLFSRMVLADPDLAFAHNNLGNAYLERGLTAQAAESFRAALRNNPSSVEPHYNLGRIYSQSGDSEGAAAEFRRAVELAPRNAASWNSLGVELQKLGRSGEALEAFRRAAKDDITHVEYHFNLGLALAFAGARGEAIASYRRALDIDPAHAPSLLNLGVEQYQLGRFKEAADSFEMAVRLDPSDAMAHNNLAMARKALTQDRAP